MNSQPHAEIATEIPTRASLFRTIGAGLLGIAVLCVHTTDAFGQQPAPDPAAIPQGPVTDAAAGPAEQAPPPPPPPAMPPPPAPASAAPPAAGPYGPGGAEPYAYPPGYAPPPGYGQPPQYPPPPSGYGRPPGYYAPPPPYGYPRQSGYYPPPPPQVAPRPVTDRPFMIGGSLGFAGLRFHDSTDAVTSEGGVGYSARLGFGIAPNLILLLGIDGATAGQGDFVYDQTIYYAGLQAFLTRQLFLRGGAGVGNITQKDSQGNFLFFGKTGLGLTGSVGVEMIQGYNWSLELAAQVTAGFYADSERWSSGAINIGFNFF